MTMDLEKYTRIFKQEAERYLGELDPLLEEAEGRGESRGRWSEIHGKIHSIKGMARALSLTEITDLSHLMEGWCKAFQEGGEKATPQAVRLLMDGVGLLSSFVGSPGHALPAEQKEIYQEVTALLRKGPGLLSGDSERPATEVRVPNSGPMEINAVKVRYSLIEELLGLSMEIMLHERSLPSLYPGRLPIGLNTWIKDYTAMLKGLHFRLAQLRLMSVGDFADLFKKTIRDLARQHGKEVRIQVVGDEVQADVALLERLREPFMHLFRNCIAHGIEAPEVREKAGKNPQGLISVEARREKSSLFLALRDDGRGINREAIRQYLRQEGQMSEEAISAMQEEEFLETILQPGFSSVPGATDLAGRGIGMSVVAQAVGYLGGKMRIRSTPGEGTTFIMTLPVSLSVIHGLSFSVGPYRLCIPTLDVCSVDRRDAMEREVAALIDLRRFFHASMDGDGACHLLRVKSRDWRFLDQGEEREIGLLADRVMGSKPMMVLPVGDLLSKARIFAGVGLMENGDLTVLVDTEMLMRARDQVYPVFSIQHPVSGNQHHPAPGKAFESNE